MTTRPPPWQWTMLVFLAGLTYTLGVEQLMRPLSPDGLHFHPWSSEDMMQTVSLGELRRNPIQSLTHIHIQPPAYDGIRAAIAQFWPNLNDALALQRVDAALYVLGAVLLGFVVTLTFVWLARQAGTAAGLLGALLVLLHPASILFATFLDSTLLSTSLFLGCYYLLWRFKARLPTPTWIFSLVVLALFFTRSIFQLPAIILFAICLWLVGVPKRKLMAYLLVTALISIAYLAKQYTQFGLFSTSSFSGMSLANSIGVGMGAANYSAYLDTPIPNTHVKPNMPAVLTSPTKLDGRPNFNHIDYLSLNQQLSARFLRALKRDTPGELLDNYAENARIYFRPTSSYSSGHVIVSRLPWRLAFDTIFSAPVLPVLLLLAFARWCIRALRTHTLAASLGILLPGLFVMLVSILADKGENMRFKYFVEPIMIGFLVSQAFAVMGQSRGSPNAAPPHPSAAFAP